MAAKMRGGTAAIKRATLRERVGPRGAVHDFGNDDKMLPPTVKPTSGYVDAMFKTGKRTTTIWMIQPSHVGCPDGHGVQPLPQPVKSLHINVTKGLIWSNAIAPRMPKTR